MSEKTVFEDGREIALLAEYEVIVCGGGPAGIAAAVTSARAGAKTALVEVHGCLGGVWTAGALSWILDHEDKPGVMAEILAELQARGARGVDAEGRPSSAYDVEAMKAVVEKLVVGAGVDVFLHTRVCAARVEDGQLRTIFTESKSGREALSAPVFIDATGDGDLAAQAGCSFAMGHPESGKAQPMSLMAIVAGLDPAAMGDYFNHTDTAENWHRPKDALFARLEAHGAAPSYHKPTFFWIRDDLFALMANHQYGVDATNARAVTRATLEARQELDAVVRALAESGEPFSRIKLVATGAQIGVREARRVRGLYEVSLNDLLTGARHDDAVCRCTFCIDVHGLDPKTNKGLEVPPGKTLPYDIPSRSLVAADVDGLMMAGRCISGDFWAHSSYRVTGNAVALGEGAGRIAAQCAKEGVTPREGVMRGRYV